MKRAVLVTGHYWGSRRRAGFHWIADALVGRGWEVLFLTAGISWLSVLRGDHRLAYPVRREAGRLVRKANGLWSYVWFTPWHPANLRLSILNGISQPLFAGYGRRPLGPAAEFVAGCGLLLFESMSGVMLCPRFRALAPGGRFIYRVSDDLRLLRSHPAVIAAERDARALFDTISVPCRYIQALFDGHPDLRLQFHGIPKALFDRPQPNPFERIPGPHAVFVGTAHFDRDFLSRASWLAPDIRFHIVGPVGRLPRRANIVAYGELPQHDTVALIRHADIGLQTLGYRPGAESWTDSLKLIQYTYSRLPIVAPDFLTGSRAHVLTYRPGDDASIHRALRAALAFDRQTIPTDDILSWEELTERLIAPPA